MWAEVPYPTLALPVTMNLKHNSAYNHILRYLLNVVDLGSSPALHRWDKLFQDIGFIAALYPLLFWENICSPRPCTAVRLGTLPGMFPSLPSAPWWNSRYSWRPSSNVTSFVKFFLLLCSPCTTGKGKREVCGLPSLGSNFYYNTYLSVLYRQAAKCGGYELRLGT